MVDLTELMALQRRFEPGKDIVWDVRCSTGVPNICELEHITLFTKSVVDQERYLPATNLRIINGWIPSFDSHLAGMLRPETKILVIQNCYMWFFVMRAMLKVLFLTYNMISTIELAETDDQFEMEFLKLDKNELSNISFVSRLTKLEHLDLSENKVEVLEIKLFQNLSKLSLLVLSHNRIKTIEATAMQHFPVQLFNLGYNQLADLNTKNWHAQNLASLGIIGNKFQSLNTVQLGRSLPNMSIFRYDKNPWNCGRLKSLQFYHETRPHKVYNLSSFGFVQCQDESEVNTVALKLPELVDLAEESRERLGSSINKLIDDRAENGKLAECQSRFGRMQLTLKKMSEGLSGLKNTYSLLKDSVEWLDVFK